MTETPTPSGIAAVINEVAAPIKQTDLKGGLIDVEIFAVPRDYELKSTKPFIDELLPKPTRRKGKSVHATPASLAAHIERYKSDTTVLFADQDAANITAIYNYNPNGPDERNALFGDHRATLELEKSDELKEWMKFAQEPRTAEQLAFFLEKRGIDLVPLDAVPDDHKPRIDRIRLIGGAIGDPQSVINTIPALKILETSKVQNAKNIATGECSFVYESENSTVNSEGEKVTVPGWFLIAFPIFKKGPLDLIPVRLRYRKKGGEILWSVDLIDIEKYIEEAFEQIAIDVAAMFSAPLFNGKPE